MEPQSVAPLSPDSGKESISGPESPGLGGYVLELEHVAHQLETFEGTCEPPVTLLALVGCHLAYGLE